MVSFPQPTSPSLCISQHTYTYANTHREKTNILTHVPYGYFGLAFRIHSMGIWSTCGLNTSFLRPLWLYAYSAGQGQIVLPLKLKRWPSRVEPRPCRNRITFHEHYPPSDVREGDTQSRRTLQLGISATQSTAETNYLVEHMVVEELEVLLNRNVPVADKTGIAGMIVARRHMFRWKR